MWHPIKGSKGSAHYYNAALMNWARLHGVDIGRGEGYAGTSLFVTATPSLGFCVETRGHAQGWQPRHHFPFQHGDRKARREQFARAVLVLGGEYLLGDYPGKVSLWRQLPPLRIPSFGECLRQVISGGKPFGDDHAEMKVSTTWAVWMHRRF